MNQWVKTQTRVPEMVSIPIAGRQVVIPPRTVVRWHTLVCQGMSLVYRINTLEYVKEWPHHCGHCGARGFVQRVVNGKPMVLDCPECFGNPDPLRASCPRCGERWANALPTWYLRCEIRNNRKFWSGEFGHDGAGDNAMEQILDLLSLYMDVPCGNCGWNWGKSSTDFAPIQPVCRCGELPDYPGRVAR